MLLYCFCFAHFLSVIQPVRRTLTQFTRAAVRQSVRWLSVGLSVSQQATIKSLNRSFSYTVRKSAVYTQSILMWLFAHFLCCVQQEKIFIGAAQILQKSFQSKLFIDYFIHKLDSNALMIATDLTLLLCLREH